MVACGVPYKEYDLYIIIYIYVFYTLGKTVYYITCSERRRWYRIGGTACNVNELFMNTPVSCRFTSDTCYICYYLLYINIIYINRCRPSFSRSIVYSLGRELGRDRSVGSPGGQAVACARGIVFRFL